MNGRTPNETPAKAIVAAIVPLLGAVALYFATGELNIEEVAFAVSALVSAVLVYITSNKAPSDR